MQRDEEQCRAAVDPLRSGVVREEPLWIEEEPLSIHVELWQIHSSFMVVPVVYKE